MPVIKKEPKQDLNQVSQTRINEITEASKKDEETKIIESVPSETISDSSAEEESGTSKKYSDVIMARLTKGKRNVFKGFFAENGITMNSGIEMCIEYVMDQVRSGNLKISKAGIK